MHSQTNTIIGEHAVASTQFQAGFCSDLVGAFDRKSRSHGAAVDARQFRNVAAPIPRRRATAGYATAGRGINACEVNNVRVKRVHPGRIPNSRLLPDPEFWTSVAAKGHNSLGL